MTGTLAGKRILIVEDEYFIASELARALRAAGGDVVGPAQDGRRALAQIATAGPLDAAVLDVNLAGEMSFLLADRLAVDGVPYLFVTGYDGWALPAAHRDTPRLNKPYSPAQVVAAVGALVASAAPIG